jgi:lipoteichoic acid synthase
LLDLRTKTKASADYLRRLFNVYWLPAALILVFVLQNQFFNVWLNISLHDYFTRRLVVTIAFGLLAFGSALLLNKRWKYLYLGLVSSLVAFVFVAQYLYYSYMGGFLQASALFYTREGMTVFGTVKIILTYRLLLFLIGPLLVLAAWLLSHLRPAGEKILGNLEKIIVGALIIIFTVSGYGYLLRAEKKDTGSAASIYNYSKLYDVNEMVEKMGVINFTLGDTIALGLIPQKATAAQIDLVKAYTAQHATTTVAGDFGLLKGRNLIIIQVESLENAVINQKYNGQEITPNLNQLAKEGLYFPTYYSPVGPGTTADAEFMTMNSLFALQDTVAFIKYAYDHYTALPGLLAASGYHTYSFHGDVASFWNRANIYPQLGYQKWFSSVDFTVPRKIGAFDLGDKDFFNQSIPKLESLPQPFMATLITLSSHTPFQLPSDLETMDIPATTTLDWLQQHYLQSIHYTDQAIGDFIDQLKTAGLYDNSLILIFGDHGSSIGIGNALGFNNGAFPDLQVAEVPLIILAPGTNLQGNRNIPASHLDVYPTVADLLGIKPPPDIFGHDLVEGKDPVAVGRNLISGTIRSIVTDKLAYHSASDGKFADGTCLEMPSKKTLPVDACQTIYNTESNDVITSDLLVKDNLMSAK